MTTTNLLRDDAYEEMASTYQCLQVDALNRALRQHGVANSATRREICEKFLFAMGNFHDQCWFEAGGRRVHPVLCFSSRFLDSDTDVGALGKVYAPSPRFAFHEYAAGNAAWYFEEHGEDTGGIVQGRVEPAGG